MKKSIRCYFDTEDQLENTIYQWLQTYNHQKSQVIKQAIIELMMRDLTFDPKSKKKRKNHKIPVDLGLLQDASIWGGVMPVVAVDVEEQPTKPKTKPVKVKQAKEEKPVEVEDTPTPKPEESVKTVKPEPKQEQEEPSSAKDEPIEIIEAEPDEIEDDEDKIDFMSQLLTTMDDWIS